MRGFWNMLLGRESKASKEYRAKTLRSAGLDEPTEPRSREWYEPRELARFTDDKGHEHVIIKSPNPRDATRHMDGYTIAGDVTLVSTNMGKQLYDVHTEDWNTNFDPRKMTPAEYQEWIDEERH